MNGFVVGLALFSLALIAVLMLARSLGQGASNRSDPDTEAESRQDPVEKTAAFHDRVAAFAQLYDGAAHPVWSIYSIDGDVPCGRYRDRRYAAPRW